MDFEVDKNQIIDKVVKNMAWKDGYSKVDESGRNVEVKIEGGFDGIDFEIFISDVKIYKNSVTEYCEESLEIIAMEILCIYNNIECYNATPLQH